MIPQPTHHGSGWDASWSDGLNAFRRTDLAGMERVQLLHRSDSKYVFAARRLPEVLERLAEAYLVLDPGKGPLVGYRNRYFDTADLRCYRDHHNGRSPRFKFRYRRYGNSGLTQLEIKTKNNRGKTDKWRMALPGTPDRLPEQLPQQQIWPDLHAEATERIRLTGMLPDALRAQLDIDFNRFTLVDRAFRDRCTVDTHLAFRNVAPDQQADRQNADQNAQWPELAIAEIKQERFSRDSAFVAAMEAMGIRPLRISKYCLGILDTVPGVRYHRFKAKYRRLCMLAERPLPESYPFSPAGFARSQALAH